MRKLLPLLIIILSACNPLITNTPRPSPQAIKVAYTSTLQPWVEILNQCANDHPEVALIIEETRLSDLQSHDADMTLWFGEPLEGISGYAISLGSDEIIVVAGENIKAQNINLAELRQIFSDPDPRYQPWTYGEGNDLRLLFEQVVLETAAFSSESRLSPSPATMLEAIEENSNAIGYIPKSWLTAAVNEITLEPELQAVFEFPILALTKTEPQGPLKSYLACMQDLVH